MSITKPVDLTGCNPEIKEAIRAGLMITCYVSDYDESRRNRKADILAYRVSRYENDKCRYLDFDGLLWVYATPVKPPERRIMPPEKAIPILIKEGWKFNDYGDLVKNSGTATLYHQSFRYFGKKLADIPKLVQRISEFERIIEEK